MPPFFAKPYLILLWLNAKGYSGTTYDALYTYFQSKSGIGTATLLDHITKTMSGLGYISGVQDNLTTFFQSQTGISNRKDAERAFWMDSSLDFASSVPVSGITDTDGNVITDTDGNIITDTN